MAYDGPLHELPPLYAGFMADLLTGPIPLESVATCSDCVMCVKPDGELPTSTYFFDRSVKCCVYMPELPNFLVGRILADPDATGHAGVRARIAAKVAVTPFGLGRPPSYDLVFRNSADTLGRSRSLRCPHYVDGGDDDGGGLCGIWKHRDAMCTTWFCRHVRGPVGAEFWRTVRELLALVEGTLARRCALDLGVAPELLANFVAREGLGLPARVATAAAIDGRVEEAHYKGTWQTWEGREEEFYRACAERVAALRWADVTAIGGPEITILARVARNAHDRLLAETVPGRLKLGSFQIVHHRAGGVRVVTYSVLDAIDLPGTLLPHLPLFDGRPTEEILRELAERHDVGIDAGYLRQLCDWGVLVAA